MSLKQSASFREYLLSLNSMANHRKLYPVVVVTVIGWMGLFSGWLISSSNFGDRRQGPVAARPNPDRQFQVFHAITTNRCLLMGKVNAVDCVC